MMDLLHAMRQHLTLYRVKKGKQAGDSLFVAFTVLNGAVKPCSAELVSQCHLDWDCKAKAFKMPLKSELADMMDMNQENIKMIGD